MPLPTKCATTFCKYRTGNAKLPIESGRWLNVPREERICRLCVTEIEDIFY